MIYVSTGGCRSRAAFDTSLDYLDAGINCVELSGGSFSNSYEKDLMKLSDEITFQVHNYFPPPKVPFVFNLASGDKQIANQSISHVRKAIRLSANLKNPVYSFHAGFRINPKPTDLGGQLGKYSLASRLESIEIFGDRLIQLAAEAKDRGVQLLIENNVITNFNYNAYGEDPLLLTSPNEIDQFMGNMPSNVGLLLDVAHLKVSANTLGFDANIAHENLKKWIKAYHLSDNDGLIDSNQSISEASWFWGRLKQGLNYYSLEVYNTSIPELVKQRNLLAGHLDIRL